MYSEPCSAPSVGTPIALTACVPFAITKNSDGYVVAAGDGTSTACVDTNMLCAMGATASQGTPPNYSLYGSGIYIGFGAAGLVPSGADLTLSVTSIPAYGLETSVTSGGTQFYAEIQVGATMPVTIPWSTFNTLGYETIPDGGAFNGTSAITSIGLQANAGPEMASWSFCVTTLTL